MAAGELDWRTPLRAAVTDPVAAAREVSAVGKPVIALVGASVPRALALAVGAHPLRLSPRRITAPEISALVPGLEADLPTEMTGLISALAAGTLDWMDGLVIARDSEAHTKLFQVLRELRRLGLLPETPQLAFLDIARLPGRPAARYNRLRLTELIAQLAAWTGRGADRVDLAGAVTQTRATAARLGRLNLARRQRRLSGSDFLTAALASEIISDDVFARLMETALAELSSAAPADPRRRILLSGSAIDDPQAYRVLEALGADILGEDHELGEALALAPELTADPVDGLADWLIEAPHGAARSGLAERVARARELADASGAEALVQLIVATESAPRWETAALGEALRPQLALATVALSGRGASSDMDREALAAGLANVGGGIGIG